MYDPTPEDKQKWVDYLKSVIVEKEKELEAAQTRGDGPNVERLDSDLYWHRLDIQKIESGEKVYPYEVKVGDQIFGWKVQSICQADYHPFFYRFYTDVDSSRIYEFLPNEFVFIDKPQPKMNQCDGCRRGLPLRDGMHYNPNGSYDYIGCTAKLYK